MDAPAQPPTLAGRHVRLRPIYPGDYDYLYALMTDDELCWRYRYRGKTPSPEQFEQQLWQSVAAQFVIEHVGDGQRIGHATSYNANERAGFAHIAVLFDPAVSRTEFAKWSVPTSRRSPAPAPTRQPATTAPCMAPRS